MDNHQAKLLSFVAETPYLQDLLSRSEELGIPNWYFGAGCISQSYWNHYYGEAKENNIKDIDWIYFDSDDLSESGEKAVQVKVQKHFKNLPFEIDVNNQARVHLWYEKMFGYPIQAYTSSEQAIESWPTTVTAVALSSRERKPIVFAPFGLDDFFNFTIRPNKVQITKEIYTKKVNRWLKCWPSLNVIPW